MSQPIKVVRAGLVSVDAVEWDKGGRSVLLSLELQESRRVFDFALATKDAWETILGLALFLDRAGDGRARAALADHGHLSDAEADAPGS